MSPIFGVWYNFEEIAPVDAEQSDDKLRIMVTKLLLNLVNTVKEDCPLTKEISSGVKNCKHS